MGLKYDDRHGKAFYQQHLRPEHAELIAKIEEQPSLIELLNKWLERMPFFNADYWQNDPENSLSKVAEHPFWLEYIKAYKSTLGEHDQSGMDSFMNSKIGDKPTGRLSNKANRSALFIMLYRDYPLLQIPFQLLDTLIEIDDLMAAWRTRHISMVRRMIGGRAGTGGSAGAEYLRESRDKHLIFSEIATLNSFLIQRTQVPVLPAELQAKLGFNA